MFVDLIRPVRCVLRHAGGVAALAIVLGASAHPARARDALTLDEALRLAQDRSRQLPALDASARASRSMAVAAGQRPDPVLKASLTNLPIDGPDRFSVTRDFMTMRSVGVMQEFTRDAKLKARSARFEREAAVAEAGRAAALADLRRDTALAWLERYYQERTHEVLVAQRDEATLQTEAADAAYRSGRGPQADVFAARAEVAMIDDRIADTERQIATATTQLARWIGPPASGTLAPPPALDRISLRPEDLEREVSRLPAIVLLLGREQLAQAEAEIARTAKQADPSVELMYSQRGPAYSNMVSINLALPLQWDQKNRQDRELAARLALVEQARAEREEATRMQVAEVLALLQAWTSQRERLLRYDDTLIPLAAQRTRAAIAAYRGAGGALDAVLAARRNEIDTRMERLRLDRETARLWARVNTLLPADPGLALPQR